MSASSIYIIRIKEIPDKSNQGGLLSLLFENTVTRKDFETGEIFHEFYFEKKGDALLFRNELRKKIKDLKNKNFGKAQIVRMKNEDWSESWKKFFDTIIINDKLVVKPSWKNYSPKKSDEIVIEIDPGMSFGTGGHPTTQFCLQLISEERKSIKPQSFLDIGCGSGILMVAAKMLGFRPVDGFDSDPEAVETSASNLLKNGIPVSSCGIFHTGLEEFTPQTKYDLVVGNILAVPLIQNKKTICGSLKKNACLILSGILDSELSLIKKEFSRVGLKEKKTLSDGNWAAISFTNEPIAKAKSKADERNHET